MRRSKGRPRDAPGPRLLGPRRCRPRTALGGDRRRGAGDCGRDRRVARTLPRRPRDAALADGSAGADRSDAENDIETTESGDGERDDYATAGERLTARRCSRPPRWVRPSRSLARRGPVGRGCDRRTVPYYDLVVVGAPTTGTVGRFVFGSTTDTVVDDAEVPVVVVEADGSTALNAE